MKADTLGRRAIPFVDLARQIEELRPELLSALTAVVDARAFIQGPFLEAFERDFASFTGAARVLGCANGTVAISLALEAAGIGIGDEVIVPAHTFAATAAAVCHVGAKPVFVDIEPAAYAIDAAQVVDAVTPRTKAVLPVHLYGVPADLEQLVDQLRGKGISIIEDAAQAHGATLRGKPVGSWGAAATYSFYPGKNLGAFGDAGAIATSDDMVATKVRKLRDHGRQSKYVHDVIGYNHRMDGMQGAILSVKLKYLARWNEHRRALAARYDSRLKSAGFKTIQPPRGAVPVYHLYIVEVSNRDTVQNVLKANGIESGIHYPVPLHRQPAYAHLAGGRTLPVTERIASRIVSLPICGHLQDDDQDYVIDTFLASAKP